MRNAYAAIVKPSCGPTYRTSSSGGEGGLVIERARSVRTLENLATIVRCPPYLQAVFKYLQLADALIFRLCGDKSAGALP